MPSSSTETWLSHENSVNKIAPAFNMVTTVANLKPTMTTVEPSASSITMTSSLHMILL